MSYLQWYASVDCKCLDEKDKAVWHCAHRYAKVEAENESLKAAEKLAYDIGKKLEVERDVARALADRLAKTVTESAARIAQLEALFPHHEGSATCIGAGMTEAHRWVPEKKFKELEAKAERLASVGRKAAVFSTYNVVEGHVCFACDMGDAGPGPKGEHDPNCNIKDLIDELAKLRKGDL